MKYYFLSGRNFNISKAELLSLLPQYTTSPNLEYFEELLITVETKEPTDFLPLFRRLGGFISFGELVELEYNFAEEFKEREKVVFGINAWGNTREFGYNQLRDLGESLKANFKSLGISAKFLVAKDGVINSIEIEKERILEKGFLLEIFNLKGKNFYGIAKAVQDVKSFSMLEYDKPYTDKKMGVLPSKLARMMVNMGGLKPGQTLWDPFCGSGTILLEGFSQGINVIGSDVSGKAVEMAQTNIEWLGSLREDSETKFKIFKFDVLKPDSRIAGLLRKTQIDALVCEPFMGPPQLSVISPNNARRQLEAVKKLYQNLFAILEHSKLTNFKAVIVVPSYKTYKGWVTLSINDLVSKKWEILNKKWGGYLQWSRSDSIIRRNIFVLYKRR
jgi:tRNA G10  N-methylase Trm11